MNAQAIIEQCRQDGINLSLVDEKELSIEGPKAKLTRDLVKKIRKNKPAILRQLVVNHVVRDYGDDMTKYLNHEQFTERYVYLTHAYRAGVIDASTLDQGLDFLLALWRPDSEKH
jgi:hypothetical protein